MIYLQLSLLTSPLKKVPKISFKGIFTDPRLTFTSATRRTARNSRNLRQLWREFFNRSYAAFFRKGRALLVTDPSVEIVAFERQLENSRKQHQRRYPFQFPDSAFVEQSADLIISNERRYSALQLFCLLLLMVLFGNIHFRPSFLILLLFLPKPIYHEVKGF